MFYYHQSRTFNLCRDGLPMTIKQRSTALLPFELNIETHGGDDTALA
jgi:hypothetical protein